MNQSLSVGWQISFPPHPPPPPVWVVGPSSSPARYQQKSLSNFQESRAALLVAPSLGGRSPSPGIPGRLEGAEVRLSGDRRRPLSCLCPPSSSSLSGAALPTFTNPRDKAVPAVTSADTTRRARAYAHAQQRNKWKSTMFTKNGIKTSKSPNVVVCDIKENDAKSATCVIAPLLLQLVLGFANRKLLTLRRKP